jgi:hypothetical protein
MKIFFTVKLALIPFVVFWALLGARQPDWAIWSGFALSLAGNLWRIWRRDLVVLEAGGLGLFAMMAAAQLASPGLGRGERALVLLCRSRRDQPGKRRIAPALDGGLFARGLS